MRNLETMLELVNYDEAVMTNPDRSLTDFGRLPHEAWQIKRSLTQKISNARIDVIYEAGLGAGVLGGKLLGAGGGGFILFFLPPERRQALRKPPKKLLCVPGFFSNRGSHVVLYEPDEVYDQSLVRERDAVYA